MSTQSNNFEQAQSEPIAPVQDSREAFSTEYSGGFEPIQFPHSQTPEGTSEAALPSLKINTYSNDKQDRNAASTDGPSFTLDQRLDGSVRVRQPAEAGNAEQAIDLIRSGNFQDLSGSLTAVAAESIRAAISKKGFFQSTESRVQQVQNYINDHTAGARITLQFDRDVINANTATGSRPYIRANIGGSTTRIPMR